MWLLSWIIKTVANVVTIPVAAVSDVYDAVTENNVFEKSKTLKKLDKIWENLDETFDGDIL